jgi:Yip1 domain
VLISRKMTLLFLVLRVTVAKEGTVYGGVSSVVCFENMMQSTYNNGSNSFGLGDDDEFAPNPFRSNNDFFESNPAASMAQPQYNNIPDPNSGMVGNVMAGPPNAMYNNMYPQPMYPSAPPQQPQDPSQYLTGTMDQMGAGGPANPPKSGAASAPPPTGIMGIFYSLFNACIQYDTLVRLFNVDTIDIYLRIKATVTKFHQPNYFRVEVLGEGGQQESSSTEEPRKGPDLYGPFWISMTAMFVLGITANINDYYRHKQQEHADEEFEYDLTHLLRALYICFSYTFGVSTFFWLVCSCLGMTNISWIIWVCHYGYSLTPILIGTCLAWCLSYSLYHWLILSVAVAISGLFIVRNLSTPLLAQEAVPTTDGEGVPYSNSQAKAAPVLLSMLGAQFTFLLVLKLTFYP